MNHPQHPSSLTPEQLERLCELAPLFDVELGPLTDVEVTIRVTDPKTLVVSVIKLPREIALRRAFSEVSSRTVRWLYYNTSIPATKVFFGIEDARLRRIGELYARWKEQGCPA